MSQALATAPVLALSGCSKRFGGRLVLDDVALELKPGQVHGLVGQNGSGKSTLIKILAGYHEPEPGAALSVGGGEVALPLRPGQAHQLGISFVHQDLGLVESGTVTENVRIGEYETGRLWRISWRRERRLVDEAMRRFGIAVDPDARISSLRGFERAMVAIVRAIEGLKRFDHGVLVLDEPTSYLPRDGIEMLFAAIREVASSGVAVLFVSHRLEEIIDLTSEVSVLREGRLVSTGPTAGLTHAQLIQRILGFSLEELYPEQDEATGRVVLAAHGLRGSGLDGVDFELREGEILGATGLIGMGYEQLPYALFGALEHASGRLELDGRRESLGTLTPRRAIAAGLALLPADRANAGALLEASVVENMTLPTLGSYFQRGLLQHRRERQRVGELEEDFDVRPRDPQLALGKLSGGNQQKVMIAKWLEVEPSVLLMHEPALGVDIGARSQIFTRIRDVAQLGTAVLIASTEWEDLARLCDRVLIFRDGRVVSELRGPELTEPRILEQSMQVDREGAEL